MWQVLLLLVLPQVSLVETHRPQLMPLIPEDDLTEQAEEAETAEPEGQKVFPVGPGPMGIEIVHRTGEILMVYKGSDAARLGWKVGQRITQVDNKNYTFRRYVEIADAAAEHSKSYKIAIDTAASETVETVEWIEWYSSLAAGTIGATLLLACPWFTYQIFRFGLGPGIKVLNQQVMRLLIVVAAGNDTGRFCSTLGSLTLGAFFLAFALLVFSAGFLLGYLLNLGNPLLDTALRKDVAREVQKADAIILVLYCALNLCIVGRAVSIYVASTKSQISIAAAIAESLLHLRYIPLYVVAFKSYWMMSRICAAARQGMLKVAEALPCGAAEFGDHVHEPCAKLLKDIPPHLVTCGAPCILLTLGVPATIISWYDELMNLILQQNVVLKCWTFWIPQFLRLGWCLCDMAFGTCVVLIGPIWLSSSLQDLKTKLNETRRRDPTMHLQVQAVNVMLSKVNNGQGWGIPVLDDFVLSMSTLQMICIRVVLAGTVIKALLDAEIGLEEEKFQKEISKLDVIRSILHNMTSLLHNRTFEYVSDVIPTLQDLIQTMNNHTVRPAHV